MDVGLALLWVFGVPLIFVLAGMALLRWLERKGWTLRIPDFPIWLLMVLTSAAAVLFVFMITEPDRTLRKQTPALIAECHAKGGTAVVSGRRHVYDSCLIPPKGTP